MTITPATSIRVPRVIAQMTKIAVMPTIIGLQIIAHYWASWHAAYRAPAKAE